MSQHSPEITCAHHPATRMTVTSPRKLRHKCPTEAKSGKSPFSVVRHKRANSPKLSEAQMTSIGSPSRADV